MTNVGRQIDYVLGAILLMFVAASGVMDRSPSGSAVASPACSAQAGAAAASLRLVSDAKPSLPVAWQPAAPLRPWKYLVLHHSATAGGSVAAIHREHRQRRDAAGNAWLGIGYHFVVGNGQGMADGAVEPTFRWRGQLQGAHAGDRRHNEQGIGICLIGNFEEGPPTANQIAATQKLVAALCGPLQIAPDAVLLHRDIAATACPGRHFSLKSVVAAPVAAPAERGLAARTASPRFSFQPLGTELPL